MTAGTSTGSAGMNIQDNDRGTRNAPFGTLGVGKFLNHELVDRRRTELSEPEQRRQPGSQLEPVRHLVRRSLPLHRQEGRNWAPYIADGPGLPAVGRRVRRTSRTRTRPAQRDEGNFAAKFGVGVQSALDGKRAAIRTELAYRADFDDGSALNATADERLVRRSAGFCRLRDPAGSAGRCRSAGAGRAELRRPRRRR